MPRSSSSPARVPVEERLFSLVLALLATENGLTKSEILSTVQGYRQRYEPHGDNSSLERQFERDKDDIRELGVPLETVEAPERIRQQPDCSATAFPKGAYDLPADVVFSPEETHAAGPRRHGLARGVAVGGVPPRPHEAALARRRVRRAGPRLRAAAARARDARSSR